MTEPIKRRGTIVEEAAETLIEAKTDIEAKKLKKSIQERLVELSNEIYDPKYREFLSRDSKAWFKLTLFYFIFYVCLALFFIFMLFIFYQVIDPRKPTYFNKDSVMNYRGVNPGLGFRPHVDPESELIKYDVDNFTRHYTSLNYFLRKYEQNKNLSFVGAHGRKVVFDYEEIIKDTPCSKANNFGFNTASPCIAVKLNKIYGWFPIYSPVIPEKFNLNVTELDQVTDSKYVYVLCEGEKNVDKDNIKEIEYYSSHPSRKIGGIHFKYFPYRNQHGYLSPLVFVHLKNITPNLLINIECKAYAKNIDNTDRLNRRGMVNFQILVEK